MIKTVSICDVRDRLSYDVETGEFTWIKPSSSRVRKGDKAGFVHNKRKPDGGRIYVKFLGGLYQAHRLAWFYTHGKWPSAIDHINGDPRDNRLCNLREATHSENQQNLKVSGKGSSGLIGVTWNKSSKRWQSSIKISGKSHYLGLFDDKQDAHNAYLDAKKCLHSFQPTPREQ